MLIVQILADLFPFDFLRSLKCMTGQAQIYQLYLKTKFDWKEQKINFKQLEIKHCFLLCRQNLWVLLHYAFFVWTVVS